MINYTCSKKPTIYNMQEKIWQQLIDLIQKDPDMNVEELISKVFLLKKEAIRNETE